MFTFSERWSCFTPRDPMSRKSLRHQHAGDLRMKVVLVWVWFLFPVRFILCACVVVLFCCKRSFESLSSFLTSNPWKNSFLHGWKQPGLHLQCQEQLQSPDKFQSYQLWLSLGAGCLCCAGLKLLLTALCVITCCESVSGPEELGNVQRSNKVKKQF